MAKRPRTFVHPMGRGALLLALLILAPAAADARPNTRAMSCEQVGRLVARAGGIVLDTSATTFDRYVSDLRFCMPQQALKPAFEPTRDNPQCFIGYTCYDPGKGDWRWGW